MPASAGGAFLPGADYTLTGVITMPGQLQPVTIQAVDGALPITTGIVKLTKGSIGAFTLAAPSAAQEGTELRIVSGSAFAHVVTATGLINNGVTGGAKSTITFGAFVGASISLVAITTAGAVTGTWYVLAINVAPVT